MIIRHIHRGTAYEALLVRQEEGDELQVELPIIGRVDPGDFKIVVITADELAALPALWRERIVEATP